jgi:hypothetical protein
MSSMSDYTIVTQTHENQWNAELQKAIPGWTFQVRDAVTGVLVPVFVPDTDYTVANVQQTIEAALAPVRQIAALGSPPAAG